MIWRNFWPHGIGVSADREQLIRIASYKMLRSSGAFSFPWIYWFLMSMGMSPADPFVLEAICQGFIVASRLPGGRLADLISRKCVMLISSIGLLLVAVLYPLLQNFWQAAILEAFWGLVYGLGFGADEALIRDTLDSKGIGKNEQDKLWGKINGLECGFASVAMFAGGLLGTLDWRIPFMIAILGFVIMVYLTIGIRESKGPKIAEDLSSLSSVIKLCLFENRTVSWIISFMAIFSGAAFAGTWLFQPILKLAGCSGELRAVLFAILPGVRGLGAICVAGIVSRLGIFGALGVSLGILSGSLMLSGACAGFAAVLILIPSVFAMGAAMTAASNALAREVESHYRATAQAVNGFVGQSATALLLFVTGFAASDFGELWTLIGLGAGSLFIGGLFLLRRPLDQ